MIKLIKEIVIPLLSYFENLYFPVFHRIDYSSNKFNWQSECINKINEKNDNGVYGVVAKTGHGKTRFMFETADKSSRRKSFFILKSGNRAKTLIPQYEEELKRLDYKKINPKRSEKEKNLYYLQKREKNNKYIND